MPNLSILPWYKKTKFIAMRDYNIGTVSDEKICGLVEIGAESCWRENLHLQFTENIAEGITSNLDFHKNLFREAGNGWREPEEWFDVENDELHIYAALSNKRRQTMNSASSRECYMKMQAKLLNDGRATCYLVETNSTKSKDEIWRITLDKQTFYHASIRRISLDKFYELVFGATQVYDKLCAALSQIFASKSFLDPISES